MKFLKFIFMIILVIIILGAAGAYVLYKNFDLNAHRSRISVELSQRLGRQVSIGQLNLSASWDKGILLEVSGLRVAGDVKQGQENFLAVEKARVGVDLNALIKKRILIAQTVELTGPRVSLARMADGEILLPKPGGSDKPVTTKPEETQTTSGDEKAKPGSFQWLVKQIRIRDGAVTFEDRSAEPAVSLSVAKLDLDINDLSLDRAFSVAGKAAILAKEQNLELSLNGRVDLIQQLFSVTDGKVALSLDRIDQQALRKALPQVAKNLNSALKGRVQIDLTALTVGQQGLKNLAAKVSGRITDLSLPSVPFPMKEIRFEMSGDEQYFDLKEVACETGQGRVLLTGRAADYLTDPSFQVDVNVEAWDLNELLASHDPAVKFFGIMSGNVKATTRGRDPEAISSALQAQGQFQIADGRVEDINILNLIISRLSMIPDLRAKIEAKLPEKYKKLLNERDTKFEDISTRLTIENGTVRTESAQAIAEVFTLYPAIKADLAQNLDLVGSIVIPTDLSAALVDAAEEFKGILDNEQRIVIPLKKYSGPMSEYRPGVDLEYLTKRLIGQRGKKELRRLIDDALGYDEEEQPPTPEGAEGQPPVEQQPKQKRPEDVLIDGVLDAIFQ